MTTLQTKADLPMPPHEAWWALLQSQMAQVAALLPADLAGVVQFEIQREAPARPAFFHLELRGPASSGASGIAVQADAWVSCTEDLLFAQLASAQPVAAKPDPSARMEVRGQSRLVQRFFEALAKAPAPRSWLETRIGGKSCP